MKYLVAAIFFLSSFELYAQHDVPASTGIEVAGAVTKNLKLSVTDLANMPQVNIGDFVIKNHKGETKRTAHQLKGILLTTLLDSAAITAEKPKEYSELVIVLTATDGYKNVYSWNELFNTNTGKHVYIITSMDGQAIDQMKERILVASLDDINTGSRYMRGVAKIEVKKM